MTASSRSEGPARLLGTDRIAFTFDPAAWGAPACRSVRIAGSFTAWAPGPELVPGDGVWTLVLPRAEVAVPGNSGEPEFRFTADGGPYLACPDQPGWPRVGDNAAVPLLDRSPGTREAIHRTACRLVTRVEDYPDVRALANFRTVSGGPLAPGRLFRSYHPFLASRDTPVEKPRLAAVARLLVDEGIGAVINLTDGPGVLADPGLPAYYRSLARRGDVLFAETSYEDAYYRPDGPAFAATLASILDFVAGRPGPFLVHCRLGMDRTGVVTAFLAALAGVPWAAVAADYVRSSDLGIREYRDQALLAHSFGRMTGADPSVLTDLSSRLAAFAVRAGVSAATVNRAVARLQNPPSGASL